MIYHSTASVFLQSSSFIPTPKPRWMLLFFTSPSESGLFCIPVIMHYGKCICKIQTPLSVDLFSRHPPWQCALVCIMLISDQSDLCYICSFSFKPFYLLKNLFLCSYESILNVEIPQVLLPVPSRSKLHYDTLLFNGAISQQRVYFSVFTVVTWYMYVACC